MCSSSASSASPRSASQARRPPRCSRAWWNLRSPSATPCAAAPCRSNGAPFSARAARCCAASCITVRRCWRTKRSGAWATRSSPSSWATWPRAATSSPPTPWRAASTSSPPPASTASPTQPPSSSARRSASAAAARASCASARPCASRLFSSRSPLAAWSFWPFSRCSGRMCCRFSPSRRARRRCARSWCTATRA